MIFKNAEGKRCLDFTNAILKLDSEREPSRAESVSRNFTRSRISLHLSLRLFRIAGKCRDFVRVPPRSYWCRTGNPILRMFVDER